jgi:hypothetical protein
LLSEKRAAAENKEENRNRDRYADLKGEGGTQLWPEYPEY